MDIFSLGCVFAELFLDGKPLFTLSSLLAYKSGSFDPFSELQEIRNNTVRCLISDMIRLNPFERKSAADLLAEYTPSLFPSFLDSFMFEYFNSIIQYKMEASGYDGLIEKIYSDFDKILISATLKDTQKLLQHLEGLSIPNCTSMVCKNQWMILIGQLVCALTNSSLRDSTVIMALELLAACAFSVEDKEKLDRFLPYFIFLSRSTACVAIKVICVNYAAQLVFSTNSQLSSIKLIGVNDAELFPDYIIPWIHELLSDKPSVTLKVAICAKLSAFFSSAMNFLNLSQLLKNEDASLSDAEPFDSKKNDLVCDFEPIMYVCLTDASSYVKRALLENLFEISLSLGHRKTTELILGHSVTMLNDQDWQLRAAFFKQIVSVCTIIGPKAIEDYSLPLILQSLYGKKYLTLDSEDFVVERVLHCLTSLCDMGLISKSKMLEISKKISPLTLHPNIWISYGTSGFIASVASNLDFTDSICLLLPILQPFLTKRLLNFDFVCLVAHLKARLPSSLYQQMRMVLHEDPTRQLNQEALPQMTADDLQNFSLIQNYLKKKLQKKHTHKQSLEEKEAIRDGGFISLSTLRLLPQSIKRDLPLNAADKPRYTKKGFNRPIHGKFRGRIQAHLNPISTIAISHDEELLASCSLNGNIKIWDMTALNENRDLASICNIPIQTEITKVQFIRNGSLLATVEDTKILLIRMEHQQENLQASKAEICKSMEFKEKITCSQIAYNETTSSEYLVVCTANNKIILKDLVFFEDVAILGCSAEQGFISALLIGRQLQWLITGSSAGILTLWDLRFRISVTSFALQPEQRILKLEIIKENDSFVVLSSNSIVICNLEEFNIKFEIFLSSANLDMAVRKKRFVNLICADGHLRSLDLVELEKSFCIGCKMIYRVEDRRIYEVQHDKGQQAPLLKKLLENNIPIGLEASSIAVFIYGFEGSIDIYE